VSEWQPIDTAPKDGTYVLVCGGVTADEDEPRGHAVAQWSNWLNGRRLKNGRWMFAWYDGGYYGNYENPTHWQPLPEPPK
jgi:hypothetical protein